MKPINNTHNKSILLETIKNVPWPRFDKQRHIKTKTLHWFHCTWRYLPRKSYQTCCWKCCDSVMKYLNKSTVSKHVHNLISGLNCNARLKKPNDGHAVISRITCYLEKLYILKIIKEQNKIFLDALICLIPYFTLRWKGIYINVLQLIL